MREGCGEVVITGRERERGGGGGVKGRGGVRKLVRIITKNENTQKTCLHFLLQNWKAGISKLGNPGAHAVADATKWLHKWLGCEPRLIVLSLVS